ncbi:uroporphyrinogen decarboxylase [Undibacterium sp. RTI2.1]|uniref:uroporphyrinogen decarboxylase n=1 Tax=unclassified Undibacterium TaxID=2630295 RepID=UPI002AB580CC|nr:MULTISPECIES: uroporphyrinogen decarboxylase [unclassified Undibacterium]MDY7539690.1 uroporphyrinogen decarboxylase [Undibacterium sp. 5I1]MEB0030707.1 uroporphyrinogen decarboxylase [Undibacterium sp. RTI2.1]MEB0117174.1 uroporphyrinogen decarboxylase [Undibacterium sp. RTI2.2]MEB0230880.1 uroporphyrinogen decarboxylase [Undibacterium sp. 10I3]MEB0257465.1 uroporphyrinogen decarboxylase [Undibacterium sp. 5I1]
MSNSFAPLKNDTFLKALMCQETDYTPLWLMRQAGRYLPEYRATRKGAGSFMSLAKNPDFATEVTIQPLDRFELDAAILFSDILTVPDAMGLGLYFEEGEGPKFERPLKDEKDVLALKVPEAGSLQYVFDAVTQIRHTLNGRVPLIGFSGSPWTLACYMVEGQGSREFHTVKTMMYKRPDLMDHILRTNAMAVATYLNAQIDAGAQAVMIFDSWGGALADGAYQRFSLRYMQDVVNQLQREKDGQRIPVIVFTKGGGLWLEQIADIGADAMGLDWTVNLGQARAKVGHKVALQGNLDPAVLFADHDQIRQQVTATLQSYGTPGAGHGHVFNLGHGISQFTPPDAVSVLVESVHEVSRQQRQNKA